MLYKSASIITRRLHHLAQNQPLASSFAPNVPFFKPSGLSKNFYRYCSKAEARVQKTRWYHSRENRKEFYGALSTLPGFVAIAAFSWGVYIYKKDKEFSREMKLFDLGRNFLDKISIETSKLRTIETRLKKGEAVLEIVTELSGIYTSILNYIGTYHVAIIPRAIRAEVSYQLARFNKLKNNILKDPDRSDEFIGPLKECMHDIYNVINIAATSASIATTPKHLRDASSQKFYDALFDKSVEEAPTIDEMRTLFAEEYAEELNSMHRRKLLFWRCRKVEDDQEVIGDVVDFDQVSSLRKRK